MPVHLEALSYIFLFKKWHLELFSHVAVFVLLIIVGGQTCFECLFLRNM